MILVTGASGLIGYHLCKRLIKEGNEVVGLIHNRINPSLHLLLDCKNFNIIRGDIRRRKTFANIFSKYDIETVFHTAAQLPYTANKDLFGVNIKGTINALDFAYENKVEEFIYASSMGVYSDPPSYLPVDENHHIIPSTEYGVTKLTGELLCRIYSESIKMTILRYAGIYGSSSEKNRAVNNFIRCALENKPLEIDGDGLQSSDFVYVDDIIQGTCLAREKTGTYNIGSGQDTTLKELAELIIELTNSKSEIVFNGKKISRPFRFFLDISKAKRDLNYSPCSLIEGLKSYIKQWESINGNYLSIS